MEKTIEKNKENKLGTESVLKLILTMSPPAILSMFIQSMYNIVDSYFVAKYSDEAIAAISLAFPVQGLMIAFCVGTSIGVASLMSRRLGQKKPEAAKRAAEHGIILAFGTYLLFLLFGIFVTDPFIRLFETNETIIQMGDTYLSICCIFSFGLFMQVLLEKILQSTGDMVLPMILHIFSALINMVLDPILIFGYFGLPSMGIKGAAIATVVAQIAGMLLSILLIFIRKKNLVHGLFKGFKLSGTVIKDIYAVGFPTIIMQAVGSFLSMAINGILAGFSAAAYTVYGLYFKLQSFVFMPIFGLNQGLMPIVAYNYGARSKKRMMQAIKYSLIIGIAFSLIGLSLFLFIPTKMLGIFTSSPEILSIGNHALKVMAFVFTPASISIVLSTLFQAIGKGMYSLINSMLRQVVLILPLAFIFSKISLELFWFSFPIAEVVSVIVSILMFIYVYKNIITKLDPNMPLDSNELINKSVK